MQKRCKLCNQLFEAKSSRNVYCNKLIITTCEVCGTSFETTCNPGAPKVCSKRCAAKQIKHTYKICEICGDTFVPNSARQKYCKKSIIKTCCICKGSYESYCGDSRNTCKNQKCIIQYAHNRSEESFQQQVRICEWCGESFNPINNTQRYCNRIHYQTCEICKKPFEVTLPAQQDKRTCSDECATQLRFINGNPFQLPDFREKAKQTLLKNYGVDHPMHSKEIVNKMFVTYKDKTGYNHPSHNPDIRKQWVKHAKNSKFEQRMAALFDQYNIEYIQHHMLHKDNISHEFDFYLPKYKFLIDCDGVYYHSYLDDPDGHHVLDYYDEDRLSLIPSDHIFHVIVEGQEERDIKYITSIINKIDQGVFDYESELFKWCRSIEFPYPQYSSKRIQKDYNRLCNYDAMQYNPACKLAMSAINQFHRSIFDAHVGDYPSPKEAWYDDKLLKKVIVNRLIYKNDVDPYKILQGFNISKICPRVSIFNPVLARHICQTYLSDYTEIFDPFSGFSGRLLGVCSTGKHYIGQDMNVSAVSESNALAEFLQLSNYSIKCANILNSSGSYESLLTCPPYFKKEHYSSETVYRSCDDWIDYILSVFSCKRYVFVVDCTEKYKDNVVEQLKSTSHFCTVTESLIVI